MSKEVKPTRRLVRRLRKLWTEALRSGKYQQTHGILKAYDGHCCLGVGFDVLTQEIPECFTWEDERGNNAVVRGHEDDPGPNGPASGSLPPIAREFLGLDKQQEAYLIERNDDWSSDFNRIARAIETGRYEATKREKAEAEAGEAEAGY